MTSVEQSRSGSCSKPLGDEAVVVERDRTKGVLAAEFGTTNETLSRTFAELRNLKLGGCQR
jgi:hypothetical protein